MNENVLRPTGRPLGLALIALLIVLAMTGCGGATTATTSANRARPKIFIGSRAIRLGVPAEFTCAKHDVSPPLEWGNVPKNTKELVVMVANYAFIKGAGKLDFVNWAVAGLSPSTTGVPKGQLPAGAIVGRNGFGDVAYSICPKRKHLSHTYIVALLALSKHYDLTQGFDMRKLYEKAESENAISAIGELKTTV